MNNLSDIFLEIMAERESQNKKWGEQNHLPIVWMGILTEEVGEAAAGSLYEFFDKDKRQKTDDYRNELIQVAAVACAAIECFDRNTR